MKARSLGRGLVPLLVHAAAFAIAGYALAQIVRGGSVISFVAWFVGAAVLHDLLLLPFYSLLDRFARAPHTDRPARVAVVNHIRVPALISGLLLLVYFPLILGFSAGNYYAATGHHLHGYARNWLAITGVLFAGSAVVYALRVLVRGKR